MIVITGTPGVGKTVVSKALAVKLGANYISIADLVQDENLVSGIDEARRTLIADTVKLSKLIREMIRNSLKDIIIEGHYAPDVVHSDFVSYVFVLRRDPEELKTEFEARGYDERKAFENISSEMLDVCLVNAVKNYGFDRVYEIDVTDMSVKEVVKDIKRVIDGCRKPRIGVIDWFNKLDHEGRLDKILLLLAKIAS